MGILYDGVSSISIVSSRSNVCKVKYGCSSETRHTLYPLPLEANEKGNKVRHFVTIYFFFIFLLIFGCNKESKENLKPVVDFGSNKTAVFTGDSIQFNDSSKNIPLDYSWRFDGGSPDYSFSKAPVVRYIYPGNYSVSLKISNKAGSDSITKIHYITVNPIVIDSTDPGIKYTDIKPDTIIHSFEVETIYSVDVNSDGVYDFQFSVYNNYIYGGMSLESSVLLIKTLNDYSSVLVDSIYPKVLSIGDTIQLTDNWGNGTFIILKSSEGCCPPNGNIYTEGLWRDRDRKCIGIRFKDKYGWIKIGILYHQYIKIYDFAITK